MVYLLTGEEKQSIPFILLAHVDLDHSTDSCLQVVPLWFRRIENLHWVGAPRDGEKRAVVKVHLELPSIECGTHDNDLNIDRHRGR